MADEKKPKRKWRDFKKLIFDLEMYCQISCEVIGSNQPTDFGKGKIVAFNSVLKKLRGTNA